MKNVYIRVDMSDLYFRLDRLYRRILYQQEYLPGAHDRLLQMQFYSLIYFSVGYYDYDDLIAQFEARQFKSFDVSVRYVDQALVIVEAFLDDQLGKTFSLTTEELVFYPCSDSLYDIIFTNDLSVLDRRGIIFPNWMYRNERLR